MRPGIKNICYIVKHLVYFSCSCTEERKAQPSGYFLSVSSNTSKQNTYTPKHVLRATESLSIRFRCMK